jgi:hypothetical protein
MGKNAGRMRALALAAVALIVSSDAFAWGAAGHETVGAIADQLIAGRRAEVEVRKLLNPGENLQTVSIWADCAKGHCGPLTDELRQFVRRNPHDARYHYTDVPFQAPAYEDGGVGTSDEDVVHILKQCIAVLKGATGARDNPHGFSPRQALLLLVHLVGDVHQPLHVGTAYVGDQDNFVVPASQLAVDGTTIFKTDGDNDLIFDSRPLHSFWDDRAVTDAMRQLRAQSPAELAAVLMRAPPNMPIVTGDVTKWPAKWATETLVAAKQAHAGLVLGEREQKCEERRGRRHKAHFVWRVSAPPDYSAMASEVAALQLTRAGYRLAAVLEAIWH